MTVTKNAPAQQEQLTADAENIVMRSGPHNDLGTLCLYLNDVERVDQSEKQRRLAFIANTAEQMLEADSREERLGAAREILKLESDCSIANAVMAREGSKSEAEMEQYYQIAIKALERECITHDALIDNHLDNCENINEDKDCEHYDLSDGREAYLLEHEAYFIVAAEFAQYLWQKEKFDQAIAIMLDVANLITKVRPLRGYLFISEGKLLIISISWLILQNRHEEALQLLTEPDDSADWLYFNALMRYRMEGDTIASRAALHHAISFDRDICDQLVGIANIELTDDEDEFEQAKDDYSFNISKSAWESSNGAIGWMIACEKALGERIGEFEDYKSTSNNKERVERLQNDLELARKFSKRGDYKEAKKHLKNALKEATAIRDDNMVFLTTFALVLLLFETVKLPAEELLEIIERKSALLLEETTPATQVKADLFYLFGGFFKEFDNYNRAADMFKLSLEQLDELQNIDGNTVDLYDTSKALYSLGYALAKQSLDEEALGLFAQALTQQEEYLSDDHPFLLETLEGMFRSMHHLGQHEEKELIRDRMFEIDDSTDYEEHSDHGPACPWNVTEAEHECSHCGTH
jgi:tetratricopeptide (TPR) repeat protein